MRVKRGWYRYCTAQSAIRHATEQKPKRHSTLHRPPDHGRQHGTVHELEWNFITGEDPSIAFTM